MSKYLGHYSDPGSISIPNWLKDEVKKAFKDNKFYKADGTLYQCTRVHFSTKEMPRPGVRGKYSFPSLCEDLNEVKHILSPTMDPVEETTLYRAFGGKQKTKKNPIKTELLDLLCLYAIGKGFTVCKSEGFSFEIDAYYNNKLGIAVVNNNRVFTPEEIYVIHKKLLNHKNNDDILTGRIEAEKAFDEIGYAPLIVKDLFSFNILSNLRGRVADVIKDYEGIPTGELTTIFQLHLVECAIKDAYENKNDIMVFKEHLKSAQTHLTSVPHLHQSTESYYYWSGRYYLEAWWMTKDSNNISNLRRALYFFNKANVEKPDGWWLLAYICITKRILSQEYSKELNSCLGLIKKRREDDPLLVSAKIYLIIAQIMEDDYLKKNDLLPLLNQIDRPKSITDLEDTVKHYIDLIFFKQHELSLKYINIIENWLSA